VVVVHGVIDVGICRVHVVKQNCDYDKYLEGFTSVAARLRGLVTKDSMRQEDEEEAEETGRTDDLV